MLGLPSIWDALLSSAASFRLSNIASSIGDDGFGPISSTRRTDFTLIFEGSVLLPIPPILLLIGLSYLPLFRTSSQNAYHTLYNHQLSTHLADKQAVSYLGGNSAGLKRDEEKEVQLVRVQGWRNHFLFIAKLGLLLTSGIVAVILATPFDGPVEAATSAGYAITAFGLFASCWPMTKMHYWTFVPCATLQVYAYTSAFVLAISARTLSTIHPSSAQAALAILLTCLVVLYAFFEGFPRLSHAKAKQLGLSTLDLAPLLSRLTFHYLQPTFTRGWRLHRQKVEFSESDLDDVPVSLASERVTERWERFWAKELRRAEKKGVKPSLVRHLLRLHGWELFPPVVIGTSSSLLIWATPEILNSLLDYLAKSKLGLDGGEQSRGWELAVGYLGVLIVQTSILHASISYMLPTLMQMRIGIMGAVYRKSFRLSPAEFGKRSVGDLCNHIIVDAERFIDEWGNNLPILLSVIPQLALGYYIIYQQLGWVTFLGCGWVVLNFCIFTPPAAFFFMRSFNQMLKSSDKMNSVIEECIHGIQSIKFNAWERPMMAKIMDWRKKQIDAFPLLAAGASIMFTTSEASSSFGQIIMFSVYAATQGGLDAQKVFVSLNAIQLIQASIDELGIQIDWVSGGVVAVRRIAAYLAAEELVNPLTNMTASSTTTFDGSSSRRSDEKQGHARLPGFEHATFAWVKPGEVNTDADKSENETDRSTSGSVFKLKDVSLHLQEGELLGVLGRTGSGKSSFVAALLGNMFPEDGLFWRSRMPIGYCPQTPFIISASIQSNITFGLQHDQAILDQVIRACCLEMDLAMIPGGLSAEVGEKGLNLSGGQKARLGLARMCYAACMGSFNLVIMDDILSAVDADTDARLFERVIKGPDALLEKLGCTRILVTHAAHHFHELDRAVVLKAGTVLSTGCHEQLQSVEEYKELFAQNTAEKNEKEARFAAEDREVMKQDADAAGILTENEALTLGRVGWRTYKRFMIYGGVWQLTFAIFFFVGSAAFVSGGQFWLSGYLNDVDGAPHPISYYLGILGLLYALGVLMSPPGWIIVVNYFAKTAVQRMFEEVLPKVFHCPQWLFDTTPSSRFINRLGSDQKQVDQQFSIFWAALCMVLSNTIVTFCSTGISTHGLFFAVLVVLVPIYIFIIIYIQASARSIRRLDAGRTRAPLYAICSETFQGTSSIHALKLEDRYMEEFHRRVNRNARAKYAQTASSYYMVYRLDVLSAVAVFCGAAFIVLLHKSISLTFAGITMSSLSGTSRLLATLAGMFVTLENDAVHVERVFEQLELPAEPPFDRDLDKKLPKEWPQRGEVRFEGYCTKYRPTLPLALKDVSMTIQGGERVAIVGRSGSGKSTMTLALFRLMEATFGKITIDDVDISELGLAKLRSTIGIIPQTATLFGGTIRSNLSPVEDRTDEELWNALELAGLKEYVSKLENKLDEELHIGGKNFSAGQLQQIGLARASLQQAKILVLDEATSNLDRVSDDHIQHAIRKHFSACTLLTIAHRIRTIIDYDKIAVMDNGMLVEFGAPKELLENEDGYFYKLWKESGEL
ncbi:hypothetical protein BT69DRAFT_1275914 [Atractiella rhizophila]|nr:hypothetical protein BT69DRAFT_1275914 [Atractiella rhizophila]